MATYNFLSIEHKTCSASGWTTEAEQAITQAKVITAISLRVDE